LTILSIKGINKINPGPFAPINRPSLNITPLSYSLRMRIAEAIIIIKIIAIVARNGILPSVFLD
jgi:hypothetical protein